jgi:alkylated DNA repair dioxygenase AlkB
MSLAKDKRFPAATFAGRVLISRMDQGELFQSVIAITPELKTVSGLTLRPNYINPVEEAELIARVDAGEWDTEWRRRVQRYGIGYGLTNQRAVVGPFPDWLIPLARRVQMDAGFERFPENSVINEYLPGQGIAAHKDYSTFGPKVACVSLGSDVLLDFISEDRKTKIPILVPARSLWVIEGDARDKWLHAIAPRLCDVVNGVKRQRARRISITFRLAKNSARPVAPI